MKAPRGGPEQLPIEYHKQYKRFNQVVKVPRGQASFTLTADIHYNYKVSGGSPPNTVMCETLKSVTARVNEKLGANFNTILMNVYKDGEDWLPPRQGNGLGRRDGFCDSMFWSSSQKGLPIQNHYYCFFGRMDDAKCNLRYMEAQGLDSERVAGGGTRYP